MKTRKFVLAFLFSSLSLTFMPALVSADDAWVGVFNFQSKMAKAGSATAQYKLGEMHEQGLGTPQDLEQASIWYQQSAQQGHQPAINRLKAIKDNQARQQQAAEQAQRETERQALLEQERAEAQDRLERERLFQEQAQQALAQKAREEALARQAEAERAQAVEQEKQRTPEELEAAKKRAAEAIQKLLDTPDAY